MRKLRFERSSPLPKPRLQFVAKAELQPGATAVSWPLCPWRPLQVRLKLVKEVGVGGVPQAGGIYPAGSFLNNTRPSWGQRPKSQHGLLGPVEPSPPASFPTCHQIWPGTAFLLPPLVTVATRRPVPLEAMDWMNPLAQERHVCCATAGWARIL